MEYISKADFLRATSTTTTFSFDSLLLILTASHSWAAV